MTRKYFPPKVIIHHCPNWIPKKLLTEQILKIHNQSHNYSEIKKYHNYFYASLLKASAWSRASLSYIPACLGVTYIDFKTNQFFEKEFHYSFPYNLYGVYQQTSGPHNLLFIPFLNFLNKSLFFQVSYRYPLIRLLDISTNFQYPWLFLDFQYMTPIFNLKSTYIDNFFRFQYQSASLRYLISLMLRTTKADSGLNSIPNLNIPFSNYFQPIHFTTFSLGYYYVFPNIPWTLSIFSEMGLFYKTYLPRSVNNEIPSLSFYSDISHQPIPFLYFGINNEKKIGNFNIVFNSKILIGSKYAKFPQSFHHQNTDLFFDGKLSADSFYLGSSFSSDRQCFFGVEYTYNPKRGISLTPFSLFGFGQTRHHEYHLFNSPITDCISSIGAFFSYVPTEIPLSFKFDLNSTFKINYSIVCKKPSISFNFTLNDVFDYKKKIMNFNQ